MEKRLIPLLAAAILFAVFAGWIWQLAPLRDAITMLPVTGFELQAGWLYLVFAPFFNVLDMISMFSTSQHIAWASFLGILFLLWFGVKNGWFSNSLGWLKALALSIGLVFFVYLVTMLMPRPMLALQSAEESVVLVDFHSHTEYSHDANPWFGVEANRWWHQHAGFDAVFVTDHKNFDGIMEGKLRNATKAKDGVQLLDGIEVYHQGGHVLALCATRKNTQEWVVGWHSTGVQSVCEPLLVQALPGPVEDSAARFRQRRIEAIEIHDGAPVALEEIKHRNLLIQKAKALNIAVVSGSDNHGWAYTSAGWSALRITDWQQMNADDLALAIVNLIRERGFTAVQVIERNMLLPANTVIGHVTMPVQQLWHMFRSISMAERVSWLIWLSLLMLMWFKVKR